MTYIKRGENNIVLEATFKVDNTWIEVESLPAKQEHLIWLEGEPLPMVDTAKQEKAEELALITHYATLINSLITEEITAFNLTTKKTYGGIESFTKYIYDNTTPQYAEAKSFLDWNSALWDTADAVKVSAMVDGVKYDASWADVIPTDEEFLAVLPARV